MALVPWGGSSATQYSTPSSPFEPNGIIYANDVNAAIRLPSLVTSAIWNTLGVTDVTYNNSLEDARSALSATVLACGINYDSSLNKWKCPNKLSFTNGAEFNGNTEFNSAISVTGNSTLNGVLRVNGNSTLNGTLSVSGDTTLSKLTVNGVTTFAQNTFFEGRNVGSTVYGSYYDYDNHTLKFTSKSGTSDPIITSISSTQISSSSLTVPFNSIYSSSGSESLEARLNRLGFKEGVAGTDYTIVAPSPGLTNFILRKLGKLVIATGTLSFSMSANQPTTTEQLVNITNEEFQPYKVGGTYAFYNATNASEQSYLRMRFLFDNSKSNFSIWYSNYSYLTNYSSDFVFAWFTEDPSNFQ